MRTGCGWGRTGGGPRSPGERCNPLEEARSCRKPQGARWGGRGAGHLRQGRSAAAGGDGAGAARGAVGTGGGDGRQRWRRWRPLLRDMSTGTGRSQREDPPPVPLHMHRASYREGDVVAVFFFAGWGGSWKLRTLKISVFLHIFIYILLLLLLYVCASPRRAQSPGAARTPQGAPRGGLGSRRPRYPAERGAGTCCPPSPPGIPQGRSPQLIRRVWG